MITIQTATPSQRSLDIAKQAVDKMGVCYTDSVQKLACILENIQGGTLTLAVAYTQAGKSHLQLALCFALPLLLKKRVGIIHVTNKSSNTLFDMTTEMFNNAGLVNEGGSFTDEETFWTRPLMLSGGFWRRDDTGRVKVAHDILIAHGVDVVVVVMDEVHLATDLNSQLARLTRHLGHRCPQALTYFIGFTATPHIFFKSADDADIRVVPIRPGKGYTGTRDLINSGRIRMFSGYNPGQWEHLVPRGNGFVVFRVAGKDDIQAIEHLAAQRGAKTELFSTDSGASPIPEFLKRLDSNPGRHTRYLMLKAGISAGDDLKRDGKDLRRNVKAWFSARYTKDDTLLQDIGRCTGYHITDTFPIYVTTKGMASLLQGLQCVEDIMNGVLPSMKKARSNAATLQASGRKLVPCTAAEYLDWLRKEVLLLNPAAKPQTLTKDGRDKEFIFRNLAAGKIGAAAWARIDFTKPPIDAADLAAFSTLKAQYGITRYARFATLKVKGARTLSTFCGSVSP